jgi:hypothetical protein
MLFTWHVIYSNYLYGEYLYAINTFRIDQGSNLSKNILERGVNPLDRGINDGLL